MNFGNLKLSLLLSFTKVVTYKEDPVVDRGSVLGEVHLKNRETEHTEVEKIGGEREGKRDLTLG